LQNWLGAGPAASGTLIDDRIPFGARITRNSDAAGYIAQRRPPFRSVIENLDRLTLLKESFMMGFRYIGGPDAALFKKRFGIEITDAAPRTIERWRENGLFQPDRCALTREGLLFLNRFILDAFDEIEENRGNCVKN
jgi:oxygen-independent coproporphyrinogen-3 oxidase